MEKANLLLGLLFLVVLVSGCGKQEDGLKVTEDYIKTAEAYLAENYNLPEGSVGDGKVIKKQAQILIINPDDFYLEFLVVKVSLLPEDYDVESENLRLCQQAISAGQNMTVEECLERLKGLDSVYNPTFLCPIKVEPVGITGSVGPGGGCIVPEGGVSKENSELLKDFGQGHRYRYVRNVLKKDPFSDEADSLVDEFKATLRNAKWDFKPIEVTEVSFPIEISGLGCNPTSISVYIDETGLALTSSEEVMCLD